MFKKSLSYFSWYFSGVLVSSVFVLCSNDIFYEEIIKNNKQRRKIDHLIPKEVFGNTAKQTFIKNKIPFTKDEDTLLYNDFVVRKKNEENNPNNEEVKERDIFDQPFKDIFNIKK